MLSKYKEEMFGEHKQECFQLIGEIREIHDRWWSDLKQHKSKKHSEFQERVRRNIQKNQERHRKATEALERMRSKASELQDKINSAWNDEFRSRAYGWLSETEDKIRDIENSIYQIEEWIREDEQKLR
jgi:predicted  nucleic acid-binding Zn-ribbon protein